MICCYTKYVHSHRWFLECYRNRNIGNTSRWVLLFFFVRGIIIFAISNVNRIVTHLAYFVDGFHKCLFSPFSCEKFFVFVLYLLFNISLKFFTRCEFTNLGFLSFSVKNLNSSSIKMSLIALSYFFVDTLNSVPPCYLNSDNPYVLTSTSIF